MNDDEHDDLWNLLGKAKQVAPSHFLARNVLRSIRSAQQQKPTWIQWLVRKWKLAALCTAGLTLAALNLTLLTPRSKDSAEAVQLAATSPDYEVIVNLDELLASQESSLWTDPSSE